MTKARTLADNFAADINGITAGTGISGGGTSGTVTVTNSMATAIDAKGDLVVGTGADTFARLAVASTAGYLLSVDSVEATGLKWAAPAGGGKVLQVVQATYSTAKTIASETYTNTDLSVSITPSSASSKVLLLVSQMIYWYREADEAGSAIRLMRDSTAILDNFGTRGNFFHRFAPNGTLTEHATQGSLVYLDSPATTSAITYKTQGRVKNTANSSTLICQENSTTSVIIAMEIGA